MCFSKNQSVIIKNCNFYNKKHEFHVKFRIKKNQSHHLPPEADVKSYKNTVGPLIQVSHRSPEPLASIEMQMS